MFEPIAAILAFFYELVPNYAAAIAMLTLLAMIITAPFTLKGTRSMMQMQMLQPEMRRIQLKYKDDRQKLNEELMAFYRENKLNPLGGCLPLLLQAPIFMALFWIVQGLSYLPEGATTFQPKYLDEGTRLFQDLSQVSEMRAFGVDLAESTQVALSIGFIHALPHVLAVALVAVTAYYQQRQIAGRTPGAEIPPQMKIMMRVFPAMFVVFAFVSPGALVVYFLVSNICRIGLQAYITHTLYRGDDSLGARAAAAAKEVKQLQEESGESLFPKLGRSRKDPAKDPATDSATSAAERAGDETAGHAGTAGDGDSGRLAGSAPSDNGASGSRPPGKPASPARSGGRSNPNRSKKKRKRR